MAAINALTGTETRIPQPAAVPTAAEASTRPARPAPAPEPLAPDPGQAAQQRADLDAALAKLGEALAKVRPEPYKVSIRKDQESGQVVILIKNAEGDVIKQYPPEKILNLHQSMDDLIGMIVDETP